MIKRIAIVVIVLAAIVSTVFALPGFDDLGNPNDPRVNERANACFEGATLYGKCDSPLMWEAGWYLIRYEAKIFTAEEIPSWVAWILPEEALPKLLRGTGIQPCVITISSFGASATVIVPGSVLGGKSGYNNTVSAGSISFTWTNDAGSPQLRAGGPIGTKYFYGTVGSNGAWAGSVDASKCPASPTAPV